MMHDLMLMLGGGVIGALIVWSVDLANAMEWL